MSRPRKPEDPAVSLARCRAQNYRLTRLLVEHDIDVPGADGFVDMTPVPMPRRGESPEDEAERLRLTLAEVRCRLNMFAARTAAASWADEAKSVMRVIDRAERKHP